MGDSFGLKARRFMGWYTPDDVEEDTDPFVEDAELAEVTPLAAIERERPALLPVPQEVEHMDLSRIVTVHPTSYNDALAIGEAFRKGVPVIMNLTEMPEADARRVVDFAAGLTFGLHGVIERVTNRVFLLSPSSVEVSGDLTGARRGSLFNQS
ncbi:MAG: cell division protein SepF [Actinomycetaceae bacterium]|nr:cell division protein SepF [Actinomycetaceae bacterium]